MPCLCLFVFSLAHSLDERWVVKQSALYALNAHADFTHTTHACTHTRTHTFSLTHSHTHTHTHTHTHIHTHTQTHTHTHTAYHVSIKSVFLWQIAHCSPVEDEPLLSCRANASESNPNDAFGSSLNNASESSSSDASESSPNDATAKVDEAVKPVTGLTGRRGLRVLPGYELDWDTKPQGVRCVCVSVCVCVCLCVCCLVYYC